MFKSIQMTAICGAMLIFAAVGSAQGTGGLEPCRDRRRKLNRPAHHDCRHAGRTNQPGHSQRIERRKQHRACPYRISHRSRISDRECLPFPGLISPQAELTFTLQFTPVNSGLASGLLKIDNALFQISSNGLGAQYSLNVQIAGAPSIGEADNSFIDFPSTVVGTQASAILRSPTWATSR